MREKQKGRDGEGEKEGEGEGEYEGEGKGKKEKERKERGEDKRERRRRGESSVGEKDKHEEALKNPASSAFPKFPFFSTDGIMPTNAVPGSRAQRKGNPHYMSESRNKWRSVFTAADMHSTKARSAFHIVRSGEGRSM